jgi:hypothetical protein
VLTAIRRPVLLLAASALLLAGCGSGLSQPNAAVIIGDRTISVGDVQHRLDTALKADPTAQELAKNHKLDLVSRGIVSQLVRHELLAEAATREGLTIAESDVAELANRSAPSQDPTQRSIQAAFDAKEIARDQLLAQQLGQKFLETLRVTFDGAILNSSDAKDKAADVAAQVAAQPDRALVLFEQATGSAQQVIPGFKLTGVGGYNIAAQNQVLLTPLYGVQPNTVIAFPLGAGEQSAGSGWVVALVRERELNAPLTEEDAALVPEVPRQWLELVGRHLSAPLFAELGVRVSPRYGVWDDVAVGMSPSEGEKVGLVLTPGAKRQ